MGRVDIVIIIKEQETSKRDVVKVGIWATVLSIFGNKYVKLIVLVTVVIVGLYFINEKFHIYARFLALGIDTKSALNRVVYEFNRGLCIATNVNPAACGPTVETYEDILYMSIPNPGTVGVGLSFGNVITLSIPQKILDVNPQSILKNVVVDVDYIMNENKESLGIKGEYKSLECTPSKPCTLDRNFDKKAVTVWFSGINCDMNPANRTTTEFGRTTAESLYISYKISYDFTTDSGIKKVGVSNSKDMTIRQEEKKIVGPVNVKIDTPTDVLVIEKIGKIVPITMNLINNGDGEAEIKEIVITQTHDPRIKPIKMDQCTLQAVQKDDKITFKLGNNYLGSIDSFSVTCAATIPETDDPREITLTPTVSYSYTMKDEVGPININYKMC